MKACSRHRIGERDAGAAVGRAAGLEPVERGLDRRRARSRASAPAPRRCCRRRPRWLMRSCGASARRASSFNERFTSGSLSGSSIEPDTSTRKTRFEAVGCGLRFRSPGCRCAAGGSSDSTACGATSVTTPNGVAASRGAAYVVVEVVDQLLDAHRVLRRQAALVQDAPHVAVGAGVDVDAERRDGILGCAMHRDSRRSSRRFSRSRGVGLNRSCITLAHLRSDSASSAFPPLPETPRLVMPLTTTSRRSSARAADEAGETCSTSGRLLPGNGGRSTGRQRQQSRQGRRHGCLNSWVGSVGWLSL